MTTRISSCLDLIHIISAGKGPHFCQKIYMVVDVSCLNSSFGFSIQVGLQKLKAFSKPRLRLPLRRRPIFFEHKVWKRWGLWLNLGEEIPFLARLSLSPVLEKDQSIGRRYFSALKVISVECLGVFFFEISVLLWYFQFICYCQL